MLYVILVQGIPEKAEVALPIAHPTPSIGQAANPTTPALVVIAGVIGAASAAQVLV